MKSTLLLLCTFLLLSASMKAQMTSKILFIRGGDGTGGFLEGGDDNHLCNIDDDYTYDGNHGWGKLADLLEMEGFELVQIKEGPAEDNTPVDLLNIPLRDYSIIVFGSNNTAYPSEMVDELEAYIKEGGAALFISDANFGSDWHKAPSSDQHFLDRFGWTMNQDQGTYILETQDFLLPNHPILEGVEAVDGEGVSPISVDNYDIPNVVSTILIPVPEGQQVQRNDAEGDGNSTLATKDDAVLVVATVGEGRIAGHFDRNTFFNKNGAGTDITRHSNQEYAINLFNWLANRSITSVDDFEGQKREHFKFSYNMETGRIDIKTQESKFAGAIVDSTGRVKRLFKNETSLDVGSLSPGFYVLQLEHKWTFPFVVQ